MGMIQISWKQLSEMAGRKKGTIIDLRPQEEYQQEHYPGAVNISPEDIENEINLPKGTLFLYCDSGIQSTSMTRFLNMRGYHAVNIKGGYREYRKIRSTLW